MPKHLSSSSTQPRKAVQAGKKRKHESLAAVAAPTKKDAGLGMQLDDILGTLTSGTAREKGKGREEERVGKKVKRDGLGKVEGKNVSALELLMGLGGGGEGSSGGAKIDSATKSSTANRTTKSSATKSDTGKGGNTPSSTTTHSSEAKSSNAISSSERAKDDPTSKKRQLKNASAAEALVDTSRTNKSTPKTVADTVKQQIQLHADDESSRTRTPRPALTSQPTSQPHSLTAAHPPTTTFDAAHQLKQLKPPLRTLSTALSSLRDETALVERIWYKNASQFRTALWWGGFNAVRRSVRRLDAEVVLRALTAAYAGLGAGDTAFEAALADGKMVKFDARPTNVAMTAWATGGGALHLRSTVAQTQTLREALAQVEHRCHAAGKTLVRHVNTPPAPTFAPLVTALLALVASVAELVGTAKRALRDAEAVLHVVLRAGGGDVGAEEGGVE